MTLTWPNLHIFVCMCVGINPQLIITLQAVVGTDVAEILLADDVEVDLPPQSPKPIKFIIGDSSSR